jgi:hypothetical protein
MFSVFWAAWNVMGRVSDQIFKDKPDGTDKKGLHTGVW